MKVTLRFHIKISHLFLRTGRHVIFMWLCWISWYDIIKYDVEVSTPIFPTYECGFKTHKYIFSKQGMIPLISSTSINYAQLIFCGPWRKFWQLKFTATVEIKGILFSALWFPWSHLQYLSSNWVFGDWRQIWDSWRYFCVRQVEV